jgi:hypothetical protein
MTGYNALKCGVVGCCCKCTHTCATARGTVNVGVRGAHRCGHAQHTCYTADTPAGGGRADTLAGGGQADTPAGAMLQGGTHQSPCFKTGPSFVHVESEEAN